MRGSRFWFLTTTILLAGCVGGRPDARGDRLLDDPVEANEAAQAGPCKPDSTLACAIELGTHGGVIDCAHGRRICDSSGKWGACFPDASRGITSVPAPGPIVGQPGLSTEALYAGAASGPCVNNPCDPTCMKVDDVPDGGVTSTPTVEVTYLDASTGGPLAASNLPPAFKTKGTLDGQCVVPCEGQSCLEACQFDQHCSGAQCVAFQTLEASSCSGVDITAAPGCLGPGGLFGITVCNRGDAPAPAGVRCFSMPGGSPQYPNAMPDLSKGTLVATTQGALPAGQCETVFVPTASLPAQGVTSLVCNPPEHTIVTPLTWDPAPPPAGHAPSMSAPVGSLPPLTSPASAYQADGVFAQASPALPGPATLGPKPPGSFAPVNGDGVWSSPTQGYATDGAYALASPADPNGGAPTRSSVLYGNFGLTLPSNATVTGVTVSARWKASVPGDAYATLGFEIEDASGALAAPGGALTQNAPPSSDTTQTLSLSSPPLTAAKLADGAFFVKVWAERAPGGTPATNPAFTASLDSVQVTVAYSVSTTESAMAFSGFGIGIPSNATIMQIRTDVVWKSSTSNPFEALTLQLFKDPALTAPLGPATADTSSPTMLTTFTQSVSSPALTPADLAGLTVRLGVTRGKGAPNPAFTALVDAVRVSVQYQVEHDSLAECNPYNNWGATTVNPTPASCSPLSYSTQTLPPFALTRVFDAKCPSGSAPQWNLFGYDASTPTGTRVELRLRAYGYNALGGCDALSPALSSPPSPIAVASSTGDPQSCPLDGSVAGCPLDLFGYLGGKPAANRPCLQMDAYGVTSGNQAPILVDWGVLYACVASE